MYDWYERFCEKGDDPTRAVSRYHSTITAKELNSTNPDSLHFVVAALAFHKFEDYLSKKLKAETPIILTFEDWRTGSENWQDIDTQPDKYPICQSFEREMARDKEGVYRYYTLSDREYKKIDTARNEIFEKQVALFLRGQTEDFEDRFSKSGDTDGLLESELEKVNRRLRDQTLSGGYEFPNPDGGTVIFNDFLSVLLKGGEDGNRFPYWYNEIIVQGGDASTYIQPKHENPLALNHSIAVHVLYQYKIFLENRIKVVALTPVKQQTGAMNIPSKTLALWCFYRESKGEYPELEGMSRKQIAEKIATENNLSSNHFRQDLSAMKKKETRLVRENIPRIQQVIEMLTDFPKSLQYAQDELKILQFRNE